MPDSRPVIALRARLMEALEMRKSPTPLGWAHAGRPMTAALAATLNDFGGDADPKPSDAAMVAAVRAFWRDQQVQSFNQLKHVCYGMTTPVDADGNRLIDRAVLVDRLLGLVDERQGQAKPFRRCYQGLLSGYFGFERGDDGQVAGRNWLKLREFLSGRLAAVQASAGRLAEPPLWLTTLAAHSNLLHDKPCARYAAALRSGDTALLRGVCSALGVESNSWVWSEAVLAYIHDLVESGEPAFKAELHRALTMVQAEDRESRLPEAIGKAAAALLVMRYAHCVDKPEHPQLRDTCIHRIGNPWLDRAAWDGAVRDEAARRMVESWLKRGLIKNFFELLAHDGAADPRRLNYWLKWEPHIGDMWFVLGAASAHNNTEAFVALRKRMRGRDRRLSGTTPEGNNAFVMRIANHYVVEFGLTGNACFVFPVESCRLNLDMPSLDIYALKNQPGNTKLSHMSTWESKFDFELRRLLQRSVPQADVGSPGRSPKAVGLPAATPSPAPAQRPVTAPAPAAAWRPTSAAAPQSSRNAHTPPPIAQRARLTTTELASLRAACTAAKVPFEDRRSKGGAIWVLLLDPASDPGLAVLLGRLGFKLAAGKGFYLNLDD